MYAECPKANSWMSSKKPLSTSEYVNAVKLSCNLIPVRSVPGRSFNTTRCRHTGCNETETIGHVLGFCRKSELLRNNRHHRVRTSIAEVLRHLGWEVHEEVHCISAADSNRRADIIAIDRVKDKAMVLDPTIRFERNLSQADEVNKEKQEIYEPCLPFLSSKYSIPLNQWVVRGMLFGARGSLPQSTYQLLVKLKFKVFQIQNILLQILRDSLHIIHYHLYFQER